MTESWLGTSLEEIFDGKAPYSHYVSPVTPSKYHKVLYELPVDLKDAPKPHRNFANHLQEDDYVKMPYSPKNCFTIKNEKGEEIPQPRWPIIKDVYSKPINSTYELEAAIKSYQPNLPKLETLHCFFEEVANEEESESFFKTMLPGIIQLALRLPEVLPGYVPLLKKETNLSVSLSQLQIASLTANAFLCTFPDRKEIPGTYPMYSFQRLLMVCKKPKKAQCILEKLKCIFHYFRRVLFQMPRGVVTFERKYLRKNQVPRWDRVESNLGSTKLHVCSSGFIENRVGCLQVDFANKYIGGGVIGYGCVQEEIRFVICPELLVSRLFTEELGMTEALCITGVERFSKYSGYGNAFVWAGDYIDATPHDLYGRRKTMLVAIDAIKYNRPYDQFNTSLILRELNKAFVGFHSHHERNLPPVATGNWGCGAFKGDTRLKFLVQLMACNVSGRNMVYYTFGDSDLRDTIYQLHLFLSNNNVKVVELWRLLCRFSAAQEKQENLVTYLQRGCVDTKKQSSIKQYFAPIFKRGEESKVRNFSSKPSSSSVDISSEEKMDVDSTETGESRRGT